MAGSLGQPQDGSSDHRPQTSSRPVPRAAVVSESPECPAGRDKICAPAPLLQAAWTTAHVLWPEYASLYTLQRFLSLSLGGSYHNSVREIEQRVGAHPCRAVTSMARLRTRKRARNSRSPATSCSRSLSWRLAFRSCLC